MLHASIFSGRRASRIALFGSLLAGGLLSGCQVTDQTGASADNKNSLATAASITNTDLIDGSAKIHIRVKYCGFTGSATTNCAYCTADEGWVRIGGGGDIMGENTPGAMLQASFPSPNFFTTANSFGCTGPAGHTPARLGTDDKSTWVVRASGATHQLQAYIVEMQLVDANGNTFTPVTTIGTDNVTASVNPPANYSVETPENWFPSDYFLIGGGADILNYNVGNSITAATDGYLVESRAVDSAGERAWKASARARSNPAQNEPLKSYAIGVESCPSQWGGRCFTYPMIKEITAAATTGYGTAAYNVSPSWVSSGVGGYTPTTNSGARYLADLIPLNGTTKGFIVRSKGVGTGGSGQTIGSTLVFGQTFGLYTYNNVFFSRGGDAAILNRPSGTNPQLQAAYAPGDQAATHWWMEAVGSGVFRLRNGNPDGGTECAYRDGSTSNVRVNACGTGNEYKWTFIGAATGQSVFQLKNVANGQCLDLNGSGTPANVVLKPCASLNNPTNQVLYLARNNWPI